jgi:hypothetical protein
MCCKYRVLAYVCMVVLSIKTYNAECSFFIHSDWGIDMCALRATLLMHAHHPLQLWSVQQIHSSMHVLIAVRLTLCYAWLVALIKPSQDSCTRVRLTDVSVKVRTSSYSCCIRHYRQCQLQYTIAMISDYSDTISTFVVFALERINDYSMMTSHGLGSLIICD